MKAIAKKFDLYGFLLFVPSIVMILLGLEWGGSKFLWRSPTIIGLFVGGGVLVILFGFWESRQGEDAMIPLHIIGKREVASACMVMWTLLGTVFVASYYLPIYFQSVKGANPLAAGLDMLPAILTQIVFAIISGVLCTWNPYKLRISFLFYFLCLFREFGTRADLSLI